MPRRSRVGKSRVQGSSQRVSEAREMLARERDDLLSRVHAIDRILETLDSLKAGRKLTHDKSLEDLFAARDRTQPGSREEEQAVERILEAVFPDSNAG